MDPGEQMDEMLQNTVISLSNELRHTLKENLNDQIENLIPLFIEMILEYQKNTPTPSDAAQEDLLALFDKRLKDIKKTVRITQKLKTKLRSTLNEKKDALSSNKALHQLIDVYHETLDSAVTLAETYFNEKTLLKNDLDQLNQNRKKEEPS